ncbi:hypothetical protein NEOLEDRAFT_1180545 [Neolentinus lepideus HHB14362 ss-1]|uniref:Uncharacterized protein n=1 Tax=Neolentinus lepideus HHB14362 ss-1 TaxID=1314782 RepID=A0A165QWG1_9AGAM|nr:hypothetical protein NEOLEDRAFT_1180545 [Neolentinus lepideus HHB14362 ss-1]
MWNHWELNWREEVRAEATSFGVIPSEGFVVFADKVVQQVKFFGVQKVGAVDLVESVAAFLGVGERVAGDVSFDSEFFWEGRADGADLKGDWFILLFRLHKGVKRHIGVLFLSIF